MPRPQATILISILLTCSCALPVCAQPSTSPEKVPQELSEVGGGEAIIPNLLGAWPLCEASAMGSASWDRELVLVADNELDQQLFGFVLLDGRLVLQVQMKMPKGKRPRDIEALVQIESSLLVVGSHSRSTGCQERPRRQRLRLLERDSEGSFRSTHLVDSKKAWAQARASRADCVVTLFTDPPPGLAEAACGELIAAEEIAERGLSCPVLNIEGAFGTAEGRVWLGLRAPLVDGRAMLLRLTPALDELRFDRAMFLALEGRGIRELTRVGETVYGIGGPAEDSSESFALFSLKVDDLTTGSALKPEILRRDLPTSSEGMVEVGGGLSIVVDGAEGGENEMKCRSPSLHYRIDLP